MFNTFFIIDVLCMVSCIQAANISVVKLQPSLVTGVGALRSTYPDHDWVTQPNTTQDVAAWGFETTKDADLSQLYQQNLEPDFAPWRVKGRAGTLEALITWLRSFSTDHSTRRVVMFRGGRLYMPFQNNTPVSSTGKCQRPCHALLHSAIAALDVFAQEYKPPDVIFLLCVSDGPVCRCARHFTHFLL